MVMVMILSGGSVAMADGDPAIVDPVGGLEGGGKGVQGADSETQSREIMEGEKDLDFFQAQFDKHIVEMKLESCPIDQILRAQARVNKSDSMRVKYYSVGQQSILTTLNESIQETSNGVAHSIKPTNPAVFGLMDTIIFPDIKGYKEDGTTRETLKPLMVRVTAIGDDTYPLVIAMNGKKNDALGNRWDLPAIPEGSKMVRLGRAAGEKDVETGAYYQLPEKDEQYCQRFIMQVEQSIIRRMQKTVVDWDFTRQERNAMDDMRGGIERSGLFGIKNLTTHRACGNIYTTGGIFWEAGKDIELGHWQKKLDNAGNPIKDDSGKDVYEYAIDEKELVAFVAEAIKDAGNGSRTKMLFVDNLIYQAFTNLRSNKRIITQTEKDYQNWHLDFESFSVMGTKILVYRHDAFNYMGMDGRAFLLDARYLDKWVFGDWKRKHYNLDELFIRNAEAVVMEEYSCWVLAFPNAHARVSRPAFAVEGAVTDEVAA